MDDWLERVQNSEPGACVVRKKKVEWPKSAALYRKALVDLSSSRQVSPSGFLMHIPFVALDCYARRYEIKGRYFEAFCYIIRALDAVAVEHFNKKLESSNGAKN